MGRFFTSFFHNLASAGAGLLPAAFALTQAPPAGGFAAYLTAHPLASLVWGAVSVGLGGAVRDGLKNLPAVAAASGTQPK